MSWYRDPQLFMQRYRTNFYVFRITKEFGIIPVLKNDFERGEDLNFSKHLCLFNTKETDFDDFKASFPSSGILKFINSQGLVINWNVAEQAGTWSLEEPSSPFWRLPGITKPEEAKISSLQEENSILKAEIGRERDEKNALINSLKREEKLCSLLEKQVVDLTSKLVQCCGAGGVDQEPWISGKTAPSNWVRFEELEVLAFSENVTLTITKATGGFKFGEDNTTNVQANCFYRGMFPIVVVNVAELTPNREEARFDPCVWGCYDNAGISYAARKPFASEMSSNQGGQVAV